MQFDPGERYAIGDIGIAQTGEQMAPEFLQSLVQQHRGRPATSAVLRDIRQSLRITRYFDGVQARYLSDERSQGNVGVKLDLAVSGNLHYAVGVGFSSDTGARVRWDLDRFRLNSEGDQFFLQTVLAQDDRQITATLKRPDHDRTATHWTSLEAGLREERNSAVRYDSAQLAISQHFADPEGWQRNRFLEALIERDQDANADVTRKMLTLGSQWERSSRNAAIFATQGYRLSATARLGLETLASDTDLLSISGQAQSIFSFDTDSRWLLSLNAGALHAGSFAALPQSLRFYAGGENSVRGYDFREIDARESIADNPGGRYLIRGSVEYERRFSSRYSWAVFSDAGDAFLNDADLKTSAGVGFRWYSPIGPVRIDVAKPLQDGVSPRLHLSFGAVF